MAQSRNSKTFTILSDGALVPTNQTDRSGFKLAGLAGFLLFVGFGLLIAIIAPHFTLVQRLIVVGIFAVPGLYLLLTMPERKWLEIEKAGKTLTVYKDKSKAKIIRRFESGSYLIRSHKISTNPRLADFSYGICVFPTEDPKGRKFSYTLMIFPRTVKEQEAEAYSGRLAAAIDNYLNDLPYDKGLIRQMHS